MIYEEKKRIIRRIVNAYFYSDILYKNSLLKVKFSDPTQDMLAECDYELSKIQSSCEDIMTLDESYKILKKDGLWSDKEEEELKKLSIDIKMLNEKLLTCKFKPIEKRSIESIIKKKKEKSKVLENKKNILYIHTKEYFLDMAFKKIIMHKTISGIEPYHMADERLMESLIVCYYKDNFVSEESLREIARSDPWRVLWMTSKVTSTPLFKNSASEMTDLQYVLVSWSRIYDFAYEHPECPGDDIINNDIEFDAWYQAESEKARVKQNNVSTGLSKGKYTTTEVFIPADPEGAKKVYELNDPLTRSKIKQRQETIEKNLVIKDADLPDIKNDIKMHRNQLAMSKGK